MTFVIALARIRKAIVAAAAVAALKVLHNLGVEIDQETVAVILDTIIVSVAVWAVPNAKPPVARKSVTRRKVK